jgi:molecular chaperone DnaJ
MANKNYYDILGISKSASEADIKKAYKKLAKEHHPDVVDKSDKAQAEKRFKEINEAYQVLGDPQKRKMYDQYGTADPRFAGAGAGAGRQGFNQNGPFSYTYSTSGGGQNPFGDVDPFDIFEEIFGFRGFSGNRAPRKGKNLYYEMRISFADAVKGIERDVKIESGSLKVKVPAGVRDGMEMRFPGKGMAGPNGAPPGDLFITFRVQTPGEFQRAGDMLLTSKEIDFIQATLGDTVEVPVVDPESNTGVGKAKLKIPQGTQPNTQFRLRNKGMPRISGSGRGDVIVEVSIKIPQRLSRKQRKILEEYKDL